MARADLPMGRASYLGLGELASVLALPVDQVLAATKRAAAARRRASWELALLLLRVERDRLFAPRYRSLTAYSAAELGMRTSSVSKHLQAARLLLALPPERQQAVMQIGPSTAYETGLLRLAERLPATAAALAGSSPTQRALRCAVERIAPKAKRPAPALDAIARGPDGLRWALTVIAGRPPVFRLDITGRARAASGRAMSGPDVSRSLDAAGVVDEILRLADALGVRGLLEARLRRRAA